MRPRLRSFELAWTDAAFDAVYPAPPLSSMPHGIAVMHPGRYFDGVLAAIPFEQSLGLRVTLWMVALAPLFTVHRFGTIASIGAEERVRVLEKLLASSSYFVRQLTMSLKAVATLLYAQSMPVRRAMATPVHATATTPSGLISAARLTRAPASVSEEGSHDDAAA